MTASLATQLVTPGIGGTPVDACVPELHLVAAGRLEADALRRASHVVDGEQRGASLCCAALGALAGGRARVARGLAEAVAGTPRCSGETRWFAARLGLAAALLDLNWWPERRGSDLAGVLVDLPDPVARPDGVDPAVETVASLVEAMASRRAVRAVLSAVRAGQPASELDEAADLVDAHRSTSRRLGAPRWLPHYADLLEAELRWRSGAAGVAPSPVGLDPRIEAALSVLLGDALLAPGSLLEQPPSTWMDADGSTLQDAARHYRHAMALYRRLGLPTGRASCLVRLVLVASATAGEPDDASWARAEAAVTATGDDGLRWITRAQRAMSTIHGGLLWPPSWDDADEELAAWARGAGSASYAAGIAELLATTGSLLDARGDVGAASCALRLAIAAARALEHNAAAEGRALRIETRLADVRRRHGVRLPSTVLLQRRLAEFSPDVLRDVNLWLEAVNVALGARQAWIEERNSAGIEAISPTIAALVERPPEPGTATDAALDVLREAQAQDGVLVPLYMGVRLQEAGRPEEAREQFVAARRRADEMDDPVHQYLVAATVRDGVRAMAALERIAARSALAPDLLLAAAVNLADWARAGALLEHAGAGPSDRPWEGHAIRAEVLLNLGRPTEALDAARAGAREFEATLASTGDDLVRTALTDSTVARQLYTAGAGAAIDVGDPGQGLAMADWLRVAPLLGTLTLLDRAPDEAVPAVSAWLAAMGEWSAVHERARFDPAAPPADPTEAEVALTHREQAVERAAPGLVGRAAMRQRPERLAQVQASLAERSALFELHAANDELLLWCMTPDGAEGRRLRLPTRQLNASVGEVLRWCADGVGRRESLDRIAESLLGPLADSLRGHDRLVVSAAGGGLNGLPIHLLPLDGRPLCERAVVSYVPAASLIPVLRARASRPGDHAAIVVGGCEYAATTGLPDLPGTLREAREVARRHRIEPLLGAAATARAVRDRLPDAGIVHVASHGIVEGDAPSTSRIALSGQDVLALPDLLGSRLRARLVVLSACDTGRGRAALGGDVTGLTRGLLTAGAAACVVSFWPVDDELAAEQMIAFHERVVGGDDPAKALATAYRVRAVASGRRGPQRSASRDLGTRRTALIDHDPSWAAFAAIGV